MDPQQRILLELAYEAFESAGWTREGIAGSRTAVYAAIFGTDYERNLCKDVLDLPVYQSVGTGAAILANRISHIFDLRGPSMTLDTGCSGGLVGLHHACQSLRSGESNSAVVASANLQLMPDHYIGMSNQHMVSSTGRCYPFDVRGEGYGRGEGFVVLALKRLSDALKDGDPIRSVILNTGINQDGYTVQGITHPNRAAQAELILETYDRIGLHPGEVAYIEAHGTGTVAGDQEELSAIASVFSTANRSTPIYVGSNKGSIGHTESTSGLASVLKTVAMLDKGIIPPVAGFVNPKPGLPLDQLQIPTKRLPWPRNGNTQPRASVNSFGYGGANAHAILERGPRTHETTTQDLDTKDNHLLVLSANNSASLKLMLEKYAHYLESSTEVPLSDISYTLCQHRSALSYRFSCVGGNHTQIANQLRRGVQAVVKPVPSQTNVIFVFTGQGAQWAGMGRDLLLNTACSDIFRRSIQTSRDILKEFDAPWDLEVELTRQDSKVEINKADLAQPATTAVQIALTELLRAQGVEPAMVIGHSSGEIAAAYAAGRLSQKAALFIAYHRGFMSAASKKRGLPRGAMLSLGLGEHDASLYLQNLERGQAVVACVNSPSSVTISGDADAIEEVMSRVAARRDGTFQRKLLVDTAYHSHHMRAVRDEYSARLADPDMMDELRCEDIQTNGRTTMVSSVTGKFWSSHFNASYWVDNLVSPVRFSDAVKTVASEHHAKRGGHALFLEIGPHPALAGPTRQCLAASDIPKLEYDYLPTLQRGTSAVSSTLELAGRLFERGIKVQFEQISNVNSNSRRPIVRPDLPTYAWDHSTKHWHESRLNREYRMRSQPYHDLLGVRMETSTSIEPHWRHMIGLSTLPWLADHVIDGLVIFPGAAYVCMAAQAIMQVASERGSNTVVQTLVFSDVEFLRALVVPDSPQRVEVQLSFRPCSGASQLRFNYSVVALSEGKWHEHCNGTVEAVLAGEGSSQQIESVCPVDQRDWAAMKVDELYVEMARDGNTYGPTFRGLQSLRMASDAKSSAAVVEVPDIAAVMPEQHQLPHILHPTTFDSMFHVGIPMIKHRHGPGSTMPVKIGELIVSTDARELSHPGCQLDVAAKLTSSHFRATHIDMTVTVNSQVVLVASNIESRSLSTNTDSIDEGICYELDWQHDMDFLRASDLPVLPTLSDLITYICFKTPNLKILEMTEKYSSSSQEALTSIIAQKGTLDSYTYFATSSAVLDESRRRLNGFPVTHMAEEPRLDPQSEDSANGSYDVVILSDVAFLSRGAKFVKSSGLLLLVLDSSAQNVWKSVFEQACSSFKVQLNFTHAVSNEIIVLARKVDLHESALPTHLRFLTHSRKSETPQWVEKIKSEMRVGGFDVAHEQLGYGLPHFETAHAILTVVVDDLPVPILSDREAFQVALGLLQQKSEIVWLSPESSPSMYQITGVARTAHAENNDLRLTTVHIDTKVLEHPRLANLLPYWLHQVANRDGGLHQEREYRITKTAAVLVPRLHRSDQLNEAIQSHKSIACREIKAIPFSASTHATVLTDHDGSGGVTSFALHDQGLDLAENDIQLRTQAFVLNKLDDTSAPLLEEYAGVIERVGRRVENFLPGDAVIAISTDGVVGHSCPTIPCGNVLPQPDGLDACSMIRLFLPALASIYALRSIVHLPQDTGSLMVHGALTDTGRATVAVARSLGASITVTAMDMREASQISELLELPMERVIIGRSSLPRPKSGNCLFDTVVLASKDPVPPTIWSHLKPFGVAITYSPSFMVDMRQLPRNATIRICNVSDVLCAQPHLIPDLMREAVKVVPRIQTQGLDFPVYNVAQVAEARRLLQLGISNRVVLESEPQTLVRATLPIEVDSRWADPAASYVLAGGMGDLGQRLLLIMARRGAKHLVTLSRRTIDAKAHHSMQEQLRLLNPGCQLHCLVCDITREASVEEAVRSLLRLGLPPVRGVIQSAVFLEDHTLENMTFDDFHRVTLTKVEGTMALEKFFSSADLHFFLTLSSTVCITGASGQANYNAGNAVQDALAHNRPPGFMSLNVGWIDDAIHTSNDKTRLQGLWRTGLRPITGHELSRYFDYLLGAASEQFNMRQAIIGFNASSLSHTAAGNSNVQSALFCHVRGSPRSDEESTSTGHIVSFKEVVENGDDNAVVEFVTSAITGQLTTLISMEASQVNPHAGSILDLGLDSLVAIELRNWIMREFDAPIQSSEVMVDQSIYDLAQKVLSRSKVVRSHLEGTNSLGHTETSDDATSPSSSVTPLTPTSTITEDAISKLPVLPLPVLGDILHSFEELRQGIDSDAERRSTAQAVQKFIDGSGPSLHRTLQQSSTLEIRESYENQVYLERREPLPETGQFTFIHPIDAPAHSQITRATILTAATFDFSRRLLQGSVPQDILQGKLLSDEGRNWLFYATRSPGVDIDRMKRFVPNHTVAVLRRGHVFQLTLPQNEEPIHFGALHAAFEQILRLSEDNLPAICTLTADERDSWSLTRTQLESRADNLDALACIDEAAFVMCLDDESPQNSGERYTQFLLNGQARPFSNRWLDKTLQLVVTANGLSAETYEHTKLDGLDARMLHDHICRAISAAPPTELGDHAPYQVREHTWNPTDDAIHQIDTVANKCRLYGPLDHRGYETIKLGLASLRGHRSPPNATAHLTILLALYLVDEEIRPAWEKVSLGTYEGGRVEWVQSVSTAARNFLEAAVKAGTDARAFTQTRVLFNEAAVAHSRTLTAASHGRGPVGPLYALRGIAQKQSRVLPELFNTRAWDHTRRGGPGQDIKIGFMRFMPDNNESEDDVAGGKRWDEAGFLVSGERGIYVHCNVLEKYARFTMSGKPDYVAKVHDSLRTAVDIMAEILRV
ncbi:t1pks [Neopestalotiopsis sp. 37M]|nr:t1pks [Neopestalotiopsis sp. 37M]